MNEAHNRKHIGWLAGLRTGWDFHSQRFASPSARSGSEMKNDGNQTAHPFSLLCFLCGRFSVGSNESRRRLFARSIAALWERRRRMMEWRVKKKREKDGERGQCVVMWSWTVFRLCSWQILHISASSICPSVSLSLVAPRKKRTGREGFADLFFFFRLCFVFLQRAVPQYVCPSFTALCRRWVSAWWPTPLHGYCCTSPEGVCLDPGSAHLQKTHGKTFTKSHSYYFIIDWSTDIVSINRWIVEM